MKFHCRTANPKCPPLTRTQYTHTQHTHAHTLDTHADAGNDRAKRKMYFRPRPKNFWQANIFLRPHFVAETAKTNFLTSFFFPPCKFNILRQRIFSSSGPRHGGKLSLPAPPPQIPNSAVGGRKLNRERFSENPVSYIQGT